MALHVSQTRLVTYLFIAFSRQCLEENTQGKFHKNSSGTFITEKTLQWQCGSTVKTLSALAIQNLDPNLYILLQVLSPKPYIVNRHQAKLRPSSVRILCRVAFICFTYISFLSSSLFMFYKNELIVFPLTYTPYTNIIYSSNLSIRRRK